MMSVEVGVGIALLQTTQQEPNIKKPPLTLTLRNKPQLVTSNPPVVNQEPDISLRPPAPKGLTSVSANRLSLQQNLTTVLALVVFTRSASLRRTRTTVVCLVV